MQRRPVCPSSTSTLVPQSQFVQPARCFYQLLTRTAAVDVVVVQPLLIHPLFNVYIGGFTPRTRRPSINSQGHFLVLCQGTQVEKPKIVTPKKPLRKMDRACLQAVTSGCPRRCALGLRRARAPPPEGLSDVPARPLGRGCSSLSFTNRQIEQNHNDF